MRARALGKIWLRSDKVHRHRVMGDGGDAEHRTDQQLIERNEKWTEHVGNGDPAAVAQQRFSPDGGRRRAKDNGPSMR